MDDTRRQQILDILSGAAFQIPGAGADSLSLYDVALTHASFAHEKTAAGETCTDNERLEFLGNYVLDFIIAEHLYREYEFSPKEMSKRIRVSENLMLADIVLRHETGIDDAILTGTGQHLTDGIIADAFEAFIGAIYLNEGIDTVRSVITRLFAREIEDFDPEQNFKGRLQEHLQQSGADEPEYLLERLSGPDNNPVWRARVRVTGIVRGEGTGAKKRSAEIEAAKAALRSIGIL